MDFLGKAKVCIKSIVPLIFITHNLLFQVVSSIVDQDKFAGFVGAQKRKEREGDKSPTPNPPRSSVSPTPKTEGKQKYELLKPKVYH